MKLYDPRNWYWFVGGDLTKVFSSASGDFVLVNNPTYTAWVNAGGVPTKIASAAELGEVLASYSLRPQAASVLDGYTDNQATNLPAPVVAKILLWCVNEIRTLKGHGTLNAAQFKAFIKSQV
jgi:hypothetical protein